MQLDRAGWSPRTLAFALGAMFCVPGVLWLFIQSRWREHAPRSDAEAADGGRGSRWRAGSDEELTSGSSAFFSSSIALCTSCFASSSCSSTSAMSIFGLPGNRSLRQ